MVVFSLMGWSPHIPSEFLVFRRTLCILLKTLSPTRLSLCFVQLSNCLRLGFLQITIPGPYFYSPFGLLRVRSPLLTESFLLSFPPGTKMFQFPGFPSHTLCVQVRIIRYYPYWVPSFGNLRITGYLLLPAAYRSLSRPSSAPCTKASTSMLFVAWTFLLNLAFFRFFSEFRFFTFHKNSMNFNSTNLISVRKLPSKLVTSSSY